MTTKASVYFHIGNGGVTLAIEDKGDGPCLVMKANHMGHNTGRVSVSIRKKDLAACEELFTKAKAMDYSPDHYMAVSLERQRLAAMGCAMGGFASDSLRTGASGFTGMMSARTGDVGVGGVSGPGPTPPGPLDDPSER